jgi:uroporphyrin-III C-methyltransferase/precorrin-2 dehydrogenase/sirohydrochlorin ferrochelatase
MDYFPILIKLSGKKVLVCGVNSEAVFKIRLLLKTSADILVFGLNPDRQVVDWVKLGLIKHMNRPLNESDLFNVAFAYISSEDADNCELSIGILKNKGLPYCIIDDKKRSDFITPAIIDRDPITIAVGSEGTSPVLVRHIKSQIEGILPAETGLISRVAGAFRKRVDGLSKGYATRNFWEIFFTKTAPHILSQSAPSNYEKDLEFGLQDLLKNENFYKDFIYPVQFVSFGSGDPDLLTRKASKALHEGDIILYDRLSPPEILELCRREAEVIEVGKSGYGPSWLQKDINSLLVSSARTGKRVIRLKSGDAGIFGRLDEEIDALHQAGLSFEIIPGITTASAAAAEMGVSLTRRGRNGNVRFLTGHDADGFADQDWRSLALNNSVSIIYMGVRAVPYIQGRLLMHGASGDMPITVAQNVGRKNAIWVASCLSSLESDCKQIGITGPAILMLGLHPHDQRSALLSEVARDSIDYIDESVGCIRVLPQTNVFSQSTKRH